MRPADHNIFGHDPYKCGRSISVEVIDTGIGVEGIESGDRVIIQRGKYTVMEMDGKQIVTVAIKYVMAKIEME